MHKPRTPVRGNPYDAAVGVATQRHVCRQSAITTIRIAVSSTGVQPINVLNAATGNPGESAHVAPLGLRVVQHTPFHGLTPMATSCRRSAAESQNTRLAGRLIRAQPSSCSCSCSCSCSPNQQHYPRFLVFRVFRGSKKHITPTEKTQIATGR